MITCARLGRSGLGNQMFQCALLRGVAAKGGVEVRILYHPKVTIWEFPINCGKLDPEYKPQRVFRERRFCYVPEVFEQPDGTDLSGYFQSEKYFKHIEGEIRETFSFPKKILDEVSSIVRLSKTIQTVGVHVRRRDFVNNRAHAGLYQGYYPNAMAMFENCYFTIISDDMKWCRQHFTGDNIIFFQGSSMYADLAAMSVCNHHIISNGTFGWWGAWLDSSPNKRVVRPSEWMGPTLGHLEEYDICPDNWEKASIKG
jgi:hypothetical protein